MCTIHYIKDRRQLPTEQSTSTENKPVDLVHNIALVYVIAPVVDWALKHNYNIYTIQVITPVVEWALKHNYNIYTLKVITPVCRLGVKTSNVYTVFVHNKIMSS